MPVINPEMGSGFFWGFGHSRTIGLILFFSFFARAAEAQQPEQDCPGAIRVCQLSYSQTNSYTGFGTTQEITFGTNSSCLQSGEVNSVWYTFTVQVSGQLTFEITPNNAGDDYDFAVYDVTSGGCAGIGTGGSPEVSCNYSATPGSTGLSVGFANVTAGPGGPNQCAPLNVITGQTYVLVVNNSSLSTFGYSLNFGGTAQIVDNKVPAVDSISTLKGCSSFDTIVLNLSKPVLCSSLATDGSQFTISGPMPVTIASEYGNCPFATSNTTTITLILNTPITTGGTYTIHYQNGTNGNTPWDLCHNALPPGDSIQFNVPFSPIADFSFNSYPSCLRDSFNFIDLSTGGVINSWQWNFGDGGTSNLQSPKHNYSTGGNYLVTLSVQNASGCQNQWDTTVNAMLTTTPKVNLGNDTALCNGTTYVLDAGNPGAIYKWSTGDTTKIIEVNQYPQTISVLVNSGGCTASDTITLKSNCGIYIPNAFTPNGDGKNDLFKVFSQGVTGFELFIYDRWGEQIFYTNSINDGWDGSYNGLPEPIGTFIYYVKLVYLNNKPIVLKGNITLLR